MSNQIKSLVIISLVTVSVFDWFTSFMGATAFFNLGKNSPIHLWAIPMFVSLGALMFNALTPEIINSRKKINEENSNSIPIPVVGIWVIAMIYDIYTTYLGLAHIKQGGSLFDMKPMNASIATEDMSLEEIGFLIIATAIFVAMPMFTYWYSKQPK